MDQQPPQPPHTPIIDITAEPSGHHASYREGFGSGQYTPLDRMLQRRRGVFLGMLSLLSLAFLFWLWLQPGAHRATSNVLLTRIGSDATAVSEGEIASEIELVYAQAASLGAPAPGSASAESVQAADARRSEMRGHLNVAQSGKSNVIAISYTDLSPNIAAERANRITDLYLQQRHRLFSTPLHLISVEAEGLTLNDQAEVTERELQVFDIQTRGKVLGDAYRIKSQRLSAIETRIFEYKASLRGQEEVIRVLRKQQTGENEALKAEAQLAGLRAQLQAMEKEYARLESQETQAGTLAAKREELAQRAALARERANFVSRRLQEARLAGMNLQARAITRAEVAPVRTIDLTWWQLAGFLLAILLLSWIGAWAVDLFDRPVYSDDEFARMTGTPKVGTATQS